MSTDELARRRRGISALEVASSVRAADEAAEEDRRLAAEDRRQAARYLSAAYRDDTTGALNRRAGREQMQVLFDRARRDMSVLTVLFVDVDGLKRVNDTQGHDRGDALLAAVGTALRTSLRSYDLVVRYGGDEFVCTLPDGTAAVAAESLARVRSSLDRLAPGATISAGWAEMRPEDTINDVIRRADTDLYLRRRSGHPSAGTRLSAVSTKPQGERRPSVACGGCGGRVALAEFVLALTARMTRSADCPDCGATTVIQLSHDLAPPPPRHPVAPVDG
jgi:diguanylate cyclase (GGDEF)-like protein